LIFDLGVGSWESATVTKATQSKIENQKSQIQSFAIIPAAGHSVRMGRPKLLMPWGEATVIEHVIAAWRASRVTRVVVVVRAGDAELIEKCRAAGAEVVTPDVPPPEMKVSVGHALTYVQSNFSPQPSDAWLLAPADMPRLSPQVVNQLLNAHDADAPAILIPITLGRRGHPVLFPWPLAAEVNRLSADEGVNSLTARHVVREVACGDPTILDDLDTPHDYQRLRNPHD
jgi:molybdenum cofactor cytidylyltransferase